MSTVERGQPQRIEAKAARSRGRHAADAVPAGTILVAPEPDRTIRWSPGMRLEGLFEERCDQLRREGHQDRLAVDVAGMSLTYEQLDARANKLARYLAGRGVRPGDRVALLFDQPIRAYTAILASLKAGAAFVPLDPAFPSDRLAYIVEDAGAGTVLTLSHLRDLMPETGASVVCLDEEDPLVALEDPARPERAPEGRVEDELAYIIYTSGSTGRPKGVAIEHPSICNFVAVAGEVYGYEPGDRVYQGMTIAFDFSVEEIWVPWMVGATLVPKPGGTTLLGMDLCQFLRDQHITAMCCVPTLLATLEEDLPELRFLLVSGEACPRDLVLRWHKPGRRFLNVYGPTEATVTATWDIVHPDKPVTLGVPLPTYSAVILDGEEARALPPGEVGEIGIAGIGLARGYVNRDDLTAKAFIPDFLGIPDNPSGRIYRSGDLGRFTEDGTIEYLGRIDTQVKIRGYRIELAEIESVLLQYRGIALAVVDTYKPSPGVVELVAYYTLRQDAGEVDESHIAKTLREKLPGYMVPAYLERLESIPIMPSGKADRKNLPAPNGSRLTLQSHEYVAPETETEEALATCMAGVLGLEKVSAEAQFFNDLGANSLLMAHFTSAVRRQTTLPPLAMQDIYQHPSVRDLAAVLDASVAVSSAEGGGASAAAVGNYTQEPHHATTFAYVMCGAVQLGLFLAYTYVMAEIMLFGYHWAVAGVDLLDKWLRSIALGFAGFLLLGTMPILLKWMIIGRWKEQEIPLWSLKYLRFWFVRILLAFSPFQGFVGTPLYSPYMRLLGAKVGKRVTFLSGGPALCADLFSIGDDSILRRGVSIQCYRARSGWIQLGPVDIGRNVYIGVSTVLDIHTSIGDNAQLGNASALHAGQRVPAGEVWHGSPAQSTTTNYRVVEPLPITNRRRITYSFWVLANRYLLGVPIGVVVLVTMLPAYLQTDHLNFGSGNFYLDLLVVSLVLFYVGILTTVISVLTIPRLLNLFIKPEKLYPIYGIHYALEQLIGRLTNLRFLMNITGDSSLVVHYLNLLGYKQPNLVQTGSNYGVELSHDDPFLTTIGSGTMVSDGLAIINAEFSNTSFRLNHTTIGGKNFFGNDITYPSGARTGENVLFGTKTLVPIDGPVRENIGLLGSPPFEIPRSVDRDLSFDELADPENRRRLLHAKNWHNAVTLAIYLNFIWFLGFVGLLLSTVAAEHFQLMGALAIVLPMLAFMVFSTGMTTLAERASTGFKPLTPTFCSILDVKFWRHERFWKLMSGGAFNGTPFKPILWRLLGVRVGRKMFDDGMDIPEKTIVSIGDYATVNAGSIIQCHSLEDGAFKLDGTSVGNDVTLGVGAFVHYGVRMEDGTTLESDSFLMKGTEVPANTRYGGNPARQLPSLVPAAGPAGL